MKCAVIFRKVKEGSPMVKPLTSIVYGLIAKHSVTCMMYDTIQYDSYDMVIQWGYNTWQEETAAKFKNLNKDVKIIYIDLGWYDRDNHYLVYDENFKRESLEGKRGKDVDLFFKTIIRNPKVYLVLMQNPGDASLRNCPDYIKWLYDVKHFIEANSKFKVEFRKHPKDDSKEFELPGLNLSGVRNLAADLARAKAAITWSSTAILEALVYRLPCVVYDIPELNGYVENKLTVDFLNIVDVKNNIIYNDMRRALKIMAGQQKDINALIGCDFNELKFQVNE